MSTLLRPFKWFYYEFGLNAIHDTGRNAYLIILARSFRMIAHGANSLVLALFLSSLNFSDYRIGLFMTLTLAGDVVLGGLLTLIADRSGRRKVLIGGSLLMVMSGSVFALVDNFWILLVAAVVGVISTTGGDFGPFRSIEESILSHLTTPNNRADVLAWYVTTSTFGSALGSEVSGRVVHALQSRGYSLADAYHVLFWSYTLMGLLNVAFTLMLTVECEMSEAQTPYTQIPQQDQDASVEYSQATAAEHLSTSLSEKPRKVWYKRVWQGFSGRLSQISAPTRSIMYKLWFLLAVDSLADGMVPYSLTNYYLEEKFNPSKSTLGDVNGIAYLLGAISTVFAGPLARRIGLVNTMVFTHIPSSAAVLVFPAPPQFAFTILLLFIRAGLNNMDQAPRSAFIAGVVKPSERTAAMGITAIVRTLAATTGPTLTGVLAGSQRFWIAFVAAGACRLVYDVGLYVLFINTKLHQHEGGILADQESADTPRTSNEGDMTELQALDHTNGKVKPITGAGKPGNFDFTGQNERLMPESQNGVRKRSPSPLARVPVGP